MVHPGHRREVCECGVVLRQCRCIGPKSDVVHRPCPHVEYRCYNCPEAKFRGDVRERKPACPTCHRLDGVFTTDPKALTGQDFTKSVPTLPRAEPSIGREPPRCERCVAGVPHDHPADPGGNERRR